SLIATFGLSQEDGEALLPSGKQTSLANRAHWARQYLSQAGLVEAIRRGHYRLTDIGADLLRSNPNRIDNKTLEQYPLFLAFRERSGKVRTESGLVKSDSELEATGATPDDLMAGAHAQIEEALGQELLSAVQSTTPSQFEQ